MEHHAYILPVKVVVLDVISSSLESVRLAGASVFHGGRT